MTRVPDSVRRAVRERAGGRCEYCRKPEQASGYAHQVEHIRPLKHGGSSEPDNLAWACFQCNIAKGTDIAAYDEETDALVPLFNPRTQQWDEHFVLEGLQIVGRTAIGRVTVRLLQINRASQVETRAELVEAGLW